MGEKSVRIVDLRPNDGIGVGSGKPDGTNAEPIVSAVIFPRPHSKVAKAFWQHSGDGISSRRAEYCHKAFEEGRLGVSKSSADKASGRSIVASRKGPRRYQKTANNTTTSDGAFETSDCERFVEERFGRNLDVSLASSAKLAVRRRIAGALTANVDLHEALERSQPSTRTERVKDFSEDDVYLYPSGMSSIFNTHRNMIACRGPMKSISFG